MKNQGPAYEQAVKTLKTDLDTAWTAFNKKILPRTVVKRVHLGQGVMLETQRDEEGRLRCRAEDGSALDIESVRCMLGRFLIQLWRQVLIYCMLDAG